MKKFKILLILGIIVFLISGGEAKSKTSIKILPKSAFVKVGKSKKFKIKKSGKISSKVFWYIKTSEELGSGDGATSSFSLGNANVQKKSETIKVNDVKKTRDTDYSIDYTAGSIEFLSPPDVDDVITADYYFEGGNDKVGTISKNGVYTAPLEEVLTSNPMGVELRAVSKDKSKIYGKANVKAYYPPAILSLKISPKKSNVVINKKRTLTAKIKKSGTIDEKINWYMRVEKTLDKGDGVTTIFSLENTNLEENSETIKVDGVKKTRDTDYSIDYTNGEVEFADTAVPEDGASVTAVYYFEGGNNTLGTIKSKGKNKVVYTAPASVPSSSIKVRAVSNANSDMFADATINVSKEAIRLLGSGIGPSYDFGDVVIGQDITTPRQAIFTLTTTTGISVGWQVSSIPPWIRINENSGTTPQKIVLEITTETVNNISTSGYNVDVVVFKSSEKGVKSFKLTVSINARNQY